MIPLTVVSKTILERVERGDAGMDRHLELEPNRGSAKAGAELCDEVMNAPGPSGGPLKDEENLLGQHLYRTFDLFLPCVPSTRRAAACTCATVDRLRHVVHKTLMSLFLICTRVEMDAL